MNGKSNISNWIKSAVINLIIMAAVMLLTHMVYETNDDYAIASRIVDGYPEIVFINYYLCVMLAKVQVLTSSLNIFVLTQILLSFISFTIVLKLLLDKSSHWIIQLVSISIVIMLSIDAYCTIQFSKAAALACTAAVLLLVDSFINRRSAFCYGGGILLLYAGSTMRIDVLIVAILFIGVYFMKWMVDNRSDLKSYLTFKQAIACVVIVTAVLGCYAVKTASNNAIQRTDELKAFYEYNLLRAEVIDTTRLSNYEKQLDDYKKAGFSKNDIKLIKKWVFDYDGAASNENLQKIIDISEETYASPSIKATIKKFITGTVLDIKDMTPTGSRILIMILLACWLLIIGRPSGRAFVLLIAAATIVFHMYLYYINRAVNRTMYTPDISAIILLLYAICDVKEKRKINYFMSAVTIIAALLLVVPVYRDAESVYAKAEKRIMAEDLSRYLAENKDSFYVIATTEKKSNASYLTPLKAPDTKSESNFMGTGSWGTKSPYILDKLENYNLENPIKDLVGNTSAYYMGNNNIDSLTEYYNKWYGSADESIIMEQVGEVAGIKLWSIKTYKK